MPTDDMSTRDPFFELERQFGGTKEFHVADVLSVIKSDRHNMLLLGPRGMDGVHELLSFMVDEPLRLHQTPRAANEVREQLCADYPELEREALPPHFHQRLNDPAAYRRWATGSIADRLGPVRAVRRLRSVDHTHIDGYFELANSPSRNPIPLDLLPPTAATSGPLRLQFEYITDFQDRLELASETFLALRNQPNPALLAAGVGHLDAASSSVQALARTLPVPLTQHLPTLRLSRHASVAELSGWGFHFTELARGAVGQLAGALRAPNGPDESAAAEVLGMVRADLSDANQSALRIVESLQMRLAHREAELGREGPTGGAMQF